MPEADRAGAIDVCEHWPQARLTVVHMRIRERVQHDGDDEEDREGDRGQKIHPNAPHQEAERDGRPKEDQQQSHQLGAAGIGTGSGHVDDEAVERDAGGEPPNGEGSLRALRYQALVGRSALPATEASKRWPPVPARKDRELTPP